MTIWKFPLVLTDLQDVQLPEGAQILTAQIQPGHGLCIWALVDPDATVGPRKIEVLGTGNPVVKASRLYIATVQMAGGSLVWHIFERTTPTTP